MKIKDVLRIWQLTKNDADEYGVNLDDQCFSMLIAAVAQVVGVEPEEEPEEEPLVPIELSEEGDC